MPKKKKKKGTGLKYIPIDDVNLIPRYLVEQIPRDFSVERFYRFANSVISNKLNICGVFVDQDSKIKGFMWCVINILSEKINVTAISIDEEYQGMGITYEAANIVEKMKKENGLKGVYFQTIFPEKFKGIAVQSKQIIMELKENE